jgi:hypothetical protein
VAGQTELDIMGLIGIAIPAPALQLGLNFATAPPELFPGKEMDEDALRVLNDIIPLQAASG